MTQTLPKIIGTPETTPQPSVKPSIQPSIPLSMQPASHYIAKAISRPRGLHTRTGLAWVASLVALVVAAPLLAVIVRAFLGSDAESNNNLAHLFSTVVPGFMLNTFALALGVLTVALTAGVGSAWIIAAYDFIGRAVLARLLVLPLAIPAFVMAYAYTDFFDVSGPVQTLLRTISGLAVGQYWFPEIRSIPGAALMLGLALYPYVYMLVRPAFSERSATLAEAARTLGLRRYQLWWRVTLPVARPAIVASSALVLMETLADFGTVAYFSVDTLAAGIYRAWQGMGDQTSAARLSLILLSMVFLVLWIERAQRGRMVAHGRQPRPAPRAKLSATRACLAIGFCSVWVVLGFLLPTGLLLMGLFSQWQEGQLGLHFAGGAKFVQIALNSGMLALAGTAVIVPAALLVAYACRLSRHPWVHRVALFSTSGYAIPGLVLAVGLLLIARGFDWLGIGWIRATIILVLLAYMARFFAVAFQAITAGLGRIAPNMDDSARSLGADPLVVLRRIHWPQLKPTLAAAGLLVFVDCLKELPATLVLRPFNFDTLAVVAYNYASDERLAAAAAPALALIVIGLIPTLWLARAQK